MALPIPMKALDKGVPEIVLIIKHRPQGIQILKEEWESVCNVEPSLSPAIPTPASWRQWPPQGMADVCWYL